MAKHKLSHLLTFTISLCDARVAFRLSIRICLFVFFARFAHGRALILDGIIQCTEKDEFSYQEMISYLPLCCHASPETVLIVGGGDGGINLILSVFPITFIVVNIFY